MIWLGPDHARLFPGLLWRQRRLGGPAVFTPKAAHGGLFKQSGCHSSARGRHQGRRALMWPLSRVPSTERAREEMLAVEKIKPQQPFIPVFGRDQCGPEMVELHQNPAGRPVQHLDPRDKFCCQGFSILPLRSFPASSGFPGNPSPVAWFLRENLPETLLHTANFEKKLIAYHESVKLLKSDLNKLSLLEIYSLIVCVNRDST